MKFNLNDFMQLDTKALLAVNGGTHCGGETGNYYGNSYSASSSSESWGGGSSYGGSHGSNGGGAGGGGCSRFDLSAFANKTGVNNRTETSTSVGGGGGSCSNVNTNVAINDTLISEQTEISTSIGGGGCSGTTVTANGSENEQISKSPTEKIMAEVVKKGNGVDSGNKRGCYIRGSYQCDEYVEEMVKGAGYNPKDYYVDNPHGKNIDTHISELKNSQKNYETDSSKLTKGSYVVFMSDNDNKKNSHASLLFVKSDGSAYMYDNSSHNFKNKDGTYSGGIEMTSGSSASAVCGQYTGYENFYFQKVK